MTNVTFPLPWLVRAPSQRANAFARRRPPFGVERDDVRRRRELLFERREERRLLGVFHLDLGHREVTRDALRVVVDGVAKARLLDLAHREDDEGAQGSRASLPRALSGDR